MSAIMVDGRGIADAVLINLKTQLDALAEPLHMAAVCIGDDSALRSFVKIKQKAAQRVGIEFSSYFFDATNKKEEVVATLNFLAADDSVHGIFIELPVPSEYNEDELISLIPANKDVDQLTGKASIREPAITALGYVLDEYEINLQGMQVAVVGQGRLVGGPITQWLTEQGVAVYAIDEHTADPASTVSLADVVITGVGRPGLITADWIKNDAIVIDYAGDVDVETISKKAKLFTPKIGGMGPLVVAAVLENLLALTV